MRRNTGIEISITVLRRFIVNGVTGISTHNRAVLTEYGIMPRSGRPQ